MIGNKRNKVKRRCLIQRIESKIVRRKGIVRNLSGHLLANVRYLVCSWNSPSHVLLNQNGTAKMRQENVLGKIQQFERNSEVAFVFRHATWPSE